MTHVHAPTKAGTLTLRLLGELELARNGSSLALPASKKTRALLGYLVATARPHARAHLCELFWRGPDDPRGALRWSLTKLRPIVSGSSARIDADREHVAFVPGTSDVDLYEVRRLSEIDPSHVETSILTRTAALFRGELLDGLVLPDCYGFHQWWLAEREALRKRRIEVLDALIERSAAEPSEALRWARLRLQVDPLAEAAHVRVIEILNQLGLRAEALTQYESCKRILASELRVKPSMALEAARMAISQSVRPSATIATTQSTERTVSLALGEWFEPPRTFVGRSPERERVQRAFDATIDGKKSHSIVVLGEPGIGKSAFLNEIVSEAHALNARVLSARAFEAEVLRPYGPWIDALRSAPLDALDPSVARGLAPLFPELGVADATGDRERLFDSVASCLHQLATSSLIVLMMDDVQWLDEASAALMHFVARTSRDIPLLMICAARPGELADNTPALRMTRALGRGVQGASCTLGPLSASETAELVRSLQPDANVERIFEEAEGHPLYAVEIARAFADNGVPTSGSLQERIRDHFDTLGERAREVVSWAAALGRSFRVDLLARASGMRGPDLVAAIGQLERHGIFRVNRAGDYDFAHDLFRAAAYRDVSEPRRRLIHRQIAQALVAEFDPDGTVASDVAHHASMGGEDELAARASVRVGERCLRVFADHDASAAAERGLIHAGRLSDGLRISLQIALLKVKAMTSSARTSKEARALEQRISRAVIEAQRAGLREDAATGFFVLSVLNYDMNDFGKTRDATLRAAEAARGSTPAIAIDVLANTGRCLVQIEREVPIAESLLDEARELSDQTGISSAELYLGRGMVRRYHGQPDEAAESFEHALSLAASLNDHWRAFIAATHLVMLELERGRPDRARERCSSLLPIAEKLGGGSEKPFADALDALIALQRNQTDAERRIQMAIEHLRAIDAKAILSYVLAFVAEHRLAAGDLQKAIEAANEALRAAEVVGRRSEISIARSVLGRAALRSGDGQSALQHLEKTLGDAANAGRIRAQAHDRLAKLAQELGFPAGSETRTRH